MDDAGWPVMICLLGDFRLLRHGRVMPLPSGGKAESLVMSLAYHHDGSIARDALLALLWPNHDPILAGQSLNSLVYTLRKQWDNALDGAPLVLHGDGCYRLNVDAGVGVDVACFKALLDQGDHQLQANDLTAAMASYSRAADLYRGDLCSGSDLHAAIERERLRAAYLTMLAQLADYHYAAARYPTALAYANRLLLTEPCREDAHRLIMRCYVRLGERAQALRQYRLCQQVLRLEFDAAPEHATTALYEQARLDPDSL